MLQVGGVFTWAEEQDDATKLLPCKLKTKKEKNDVLICFVAELKVEPRATIRTRTENNKGKGIR